MASGSGRMKTALTWLGILSFIAISWALDNPPWLNTLVFLFVGITVFYAVINLEEKAAKAEYENARLKEDLDRKDLWLNDLQIRVEDLESQNRAR